MDQKTFEKNYKGERVQWIYDRSIKGEIVAQVRTGLFMDMEVKADNGKNYVFPLDQLEFSD